MGNRKKFKIDPAELKIKQLISGITLVIALLFIFGNEWYGAKMIGLWLLGFAVGFSIWENFVSLLD